MPILELLLAFNRAARADAKPVVGLSVFYAALAGIAAVTGMLTLAPPLVRIQLLYPDDARGLPPDATVRAFAGSMLRPAAGARLPSSRAYAAFCLWSILAGLRPLPIGLFEARLAAHVRCHGEQHGIGIGGRPPGTRRPGTVASPVGPAAGGWLRRTYDHKPTASAVRTNGRSQ